MDDSGRTIHRILQAQSGDRAALDELFRLIQHPLYGYLCRLTGDRAQAEDLLQDVFLLVHRKLRWLRDPALFDAWVYRIASREVMRRVSADRRWRSGTDLEATIEEMAAPPPPDTYMPELLPRLPELLAQLSPASRVVIVLHYLQEKSLSEVADILGISAGTTKSRLAYGLAALRRRMRES